MIKYKTIIVSDLHLGTKDSQAKEFLKFLDEHPTKQLILNGDIIDAWALERGSKWRKQHSKVILKLLELSKKTDIILIRGNHDDFLKDYFHIKMNNITICENYTLTLRGIATSRKYLIFHGDVLDLFSSKWTLIAKIGSIGYDLALFLNRWYNKYRIWRGLPYYSISKTLKHKVKQAVSFIGDFEINAITIAKQHGCDGVIVGHIHTPANKLIKDTHYLNSGDWVESKTAILIDKDDNIKTFGF
jgi:UDP-2,3-diacylglucosamine pyrophosphatase LpxH